MLTKVELGSDGKRVIYHRTEGGQEAWTHPEGEPLPSRPCTCAKPLRRKPQSSNTSPPVSASSRL